MHAFSQTQDTKYVMGQLRGVTRLPPLDDQRQWRRPTFGKYQPRKIEVSGNQHPSLATRPVKQVIIACARNQFMRIDYGHTCLAQRNDHTMMDVLVNEYR